MLIASNFFVIALLWQGTTDSDKQFTLKKTDTVQYEYNFRMLLNV